MEALNWITLTGFEVRVAERLDEITKRNKLPQVEDVVLVSDWPLPNDDHNEFEFQAFAKEGKAFVNMFADIEETDDGWFEIYFDEEYISEKLDLLNFEI